MLLAKDWFKQVLPPLVADSAIRNIKDDKTKFKSFGDALGLSFIWASTLQGQNYWAYINKKYSMKEKIRGSFYVEKKKAINTIFTKYRIINKVCYYISASKCYLVPYDKIIQNEP
jgi:hypothetical protein